MSIFSFIKKRTKPIPSKKYAKSVPTLKSWVDTKNGPVSLKEINLTLRNLNPKYKIPFSMYVSGYTIDEIANALNCTSDCVIKRITRAYQDLEDGLFTND